MQDINPYCMVMSPQMILGWHKKQEHYRHHIIAMHGVPSSERESTTMVIGNESDHNTAPGRATMTATSASGLGVLDELDPMPLKDAQDAFTRQHVSHALKLNKGKRARTARYLCISREGLWKIINRLDIDMSTEEER
jgi:DNA-binding NtrC family response regulator